MQVVLTNEDLTKLDEIIQNTPFKYAAPFFQFFQAKLQEEHQKAQAQVSEKPAEIEKKVKK